jgi:serine/threonine protein kinase
MIIVTELCNTDLDNLIRNNDIFANGMPEELVIDILKNLVSGFENLHQRNIIHRDIKLENIFVTFPENKTEIPIDTRLKVPFLRKANYKIGDFGVAKRLK